MRRLALLSALLLVVVACGDDDDGAASGDSATSEARVSITSPADGARVAGGLTMDMAAEGLTIEAAGEAREGAGHFHVIVDDGCVDPGDPVPKDADHLHFGKGQSTGSVYLAPGEHELCLQAADGAHIARSETATISVVAGIETLDEWCGTIGEVDLLFESTDAGDVPFAEQQVGYQHLSRLIAQLRDAEEVVPEADRETVLAAVSLAGAFADALGSAADQAAAESAFEEIVIGSEATFDAAEPWIKATCGVDVDD